MLPGNLCDAYVIDDFSHALPVGHQLADDVVLGLAGKGPAEMDDSMAAHDAQLLGVDASVALRRSGGRTLFPVLGRWCRRACVQARGLMA